MLSSKLLLLLIGSIAISSCLATKENWGLDDEAQQMSKRIQDLNDDDDDDDDDGDIFAMEDNFDNIDELLGKELARNIARGQWGWGRRVIRKVGDFVKKNATCNNAKKACNVARLTGNPKVHVICAGVNVACALG